MPMSTNSNYNNLIDFIGENQNRFYLLAYSYVKNPHTALDMVQEAVYKALKSADSIKEPSHIKTWFYRILINTSLDELRRQKRDVILEDDALASAFLETFQPDGEAQHTEAIDLYAALESLDFKSRTVINLRYFEGMKLSEIADILDEGVSTVKSRLYRALDALKFKLEGDAVNE